MKVALRLKVKCCNCLNSYFRLRGKYYDCVDGICVLCGEPKELGDILADLLSEGVLKSVEVLGMAYTLDSFAELEAQGGQERK